MEKRILVMGLVFLLLFSSVIPISMAYTAKTPSIVMQPSNRGNTLYVGGSGTNNYTKIQDAIDNANSGDTVFVYDDSSPYYGVILVNKSISLIGEDKNTTIIDGDKVGDVIIVDADSVTISGFTIIDSKPGVDPSRPPLEWAGVYCYASFTTISNNILKNNYFGIAIWYCPQKQHKNNGEKFYGSNISNNIIISNFDTGVMLMDCYNSTVINNNISNNNNGIQIYTSYNCIISGNKISNNNDGIALYADDNSFFEISFNNITKNKSFGINIQDSGMNKILKNNFIKNGFGSVRFVYFMFWIFQLKNNWDGNYWNKPRIYPYLILGGLYILLPYISIIPWFEIDWHPALKPYDIGVRS